MSDVPALQPLLQDLAFPECPRWHEGALWFSDVADGTLLRLGEDHRVETVHRGAPGLAGLGWQPDGTLLMVAGAERLLLALGTGGRVGVHADLREWVGQSANDMTVDAQGRAYVGQWGFRFAQGDAPRPAPLLCVSPTGSVSVAAPDLLFANGMVITPDGRTLLVAETFARRLSAFRIAADGTLHDRRVWAALPRAAPDGICLDAEGALWVASPTSREVLRVREGGEVLQRLPTAEQALACMLGGPDRRTLYVASAALFERGEGGVRYHEYDALRRLRRGRIDAVRVEVPGAGRP